MEGFRHKKDGDNFFSKADRSAFVFQEWQALTIEKEEIIPTNWRFIPDTYENYRVYAFKTGHFITVTSTDLDHLETLFSPFFS